MTRVLILTATVGEGHDLPARTLAAQLREESPDSEVVTEDGLRAMGRGFVLVNQKAAEVVFFRLSPALAVGRGVLALRRVCARRDGCPSAWCTRSGRAGCFASFVACGPT